MTKAMLLVFAGVPVTPLPHFMYGGEGGPQGPAEPGVLGAMQGQWKKGM